MSGRHPDIASEGRHTVIDVFATLYGYGSLLGRSVTLITAEDSIMGERGKVLASADIVIKEDSSVKKIKFNIDRRYVKNISRSSLQEDISNKTGISNWQIAGLELTFSPGLPCCVITFFLIDDRIDANVEELEDIFLSMYLSNEDHMDHHAFTTCTESSTLKSSIPYTIYTIIGCSCAGAVLLMIGIATLYKFRKNRYVLEMEHPASSNIEKPDVSV